MSRTRARIDLPSFETFPGPKLGAFPSLQGTQTWHVTSARASVLAHSPFSSRYVHYVEYADPNRRYAGTALALTKFAHSFILPEHPPFLPRVSTISTCTFGDASLAILLGSLNTGQLYDMVGESEDHPSQELINDLDKGGHAQHSNPGQG